MFQDTETSLRFSVLIRKEFKNRLRSSRTVYRSVRAKHQGSHDVNLDSCLKTADGEEKTKPCLLKPGAEEASVFLQWSLASLCMAEVGVAKSPEN